MKTCPKCNSTFTDETLNFCLTDGAPLVEAGASASEFNLQEAETIFDANLKVFQPESSHVTSPNTPPNTADKVRLNTNSFSTNKKKNPLPYLRPLLGVLAMVAAIGAIFWWLYTNNDTAATTQKNNPSSQEANKPRATVALTPEQENLIKKEVAELVEDWRKSIEKRDADANVKFYAQTLDTYYRESGIDRNHVRADRQRAIDRYETLALQVDKLQIKPETPETASATFDKSWNFKSPVKVATGSVQQEMYFIKQKGKWLINGEKDVKVYYLNNRENTPDEANTNQNSSENK
ncbi:MAG: hypothetical protein K1X72_01260 [Pyrinomonadaceae bacterium]|nr:hypothetical protein [Pyrinomonadaceae bacterium]